jgi:predicted nucleic acid-binding Zn ribbon protein
VSVVCSFNHTRSGAEILGVLLRRLTSRYVAGLWRALMTCIVCGNQVVQRAAGAGRRRLLCSARCKRVRQTQHSARCHAEGRYPARRTVYSGRCVVCGVPFKAENRPTKTCGRRCGKILSDGTRSANARARKTRYRARCSAPFVPAHREAAPGRACPTVLFQGLRQSRATRSTRRVTGAECRSGPFCSGFDPECCPKSEAFVLV